MNCSFKRFFWHHCAASQHCVLETTGEVRPVNNEFRLYACSPGDLLPQLTAQNLRCWFLSLLPACVFAGSTDSRRRRLLVPPSGTESSTPELLEREKYFIFVLRVCSILAQNTSEAVY